MLSAVLLPVLFARTQVFLQAKWTGSVAQLSGELLRCKVSTVLLQVINKLAGSLHFAPINKTAHHNAPNSQPWAYQQENSEARLPSQTLLSNLSVVEATLHILSGRYALSNHGRIVYQKDHESHIHLRFISKNSLLRSVSFILATEGDTHTQQSQVQWRSFSNVPLHNVSSAITAVAPKTEL